MRAFSQVVVLFVIAWASVAVGQETTDPHAARIANDVSHEVLSPFCPGKTLAMCPSPAAAEVRMQIQDMAQSGMSEAQIKEAILAEHGEEFRIVEPPATDNFGLLGALGGALALAVLAVVVISRRRGSASEPPASPPRDAEPEPDDEYLAELRKQYRN